MSLRIKDQTRSNLVGASFLSIMVIAAAVILATVPKWDKTPTVKDYIFLFAIVVGIPLLSIAAVAVMVWHARKFGRGTLVVTSTPLQLSGPLVGHVEINRRLANVSGFRLRFEFVKFVPRARSLSETILWKDENLLKTQEFAFRAQATIVPVNFTIPDAPAGSEGPLGSYCRWRVTAEALPDKGAHFWTEFLFPPELLPTKASKAGEKIV